MSASTTSDSQSTFSFAKLNDSNYATWKLEMRAALQAKTLWRIASGIATKPSKAEEQEAWEEKSEQAAGFIYGKLEHGMQILVQDDLGNPVEMLKKLKELNQQDNAASRFIAYDEFFSIAKAEDESLTALTARV